MIDFYIFLISGVVN